MPKITNRSDVRELLNVDDSKINSALAKCMGDYVHSESGGYPAYCSEDSPRRLLGEVEARLAAKHHSSAAAYPRAVEAMTSLSTPLKTDVVTLTADAAIRARAALWVLDRPAAERLIEALDVEAANG